MRRPLDRDRLQRLLRELGRSAAGPGRIYLVGGTTAVMHGWRTSTVDADLVLDPEPRGVMRQLAALKDRLEVNIELAGPAQFIPELPGWRDRSLYVDRYGAVDFYHYDLYSQALAKIERDHDRDRADVNAMLEDGLVERERLGELFAAIRDELYRYPSLDLDAFEAKVARWT